MPAPRELPAWSATALVATLIGGLMAWPVLRNPFELLIGHPMSPGADHLWGLWVTADGLWQHGPLLRDSPGTNFPEGFRALQYEAANLLLFLPGYWLGLGGASGAALGWNLLHVLAPVLGALGCWKLGRDLVGPHPAIVVFVAVFAGSPFLLAHPTMGHSEYLPAMLWPWHLWALRRFLEGGRWTWALGSGVALGLMAATASYLPVFLALLNVPIGLGLAWRRRAFFRLGLVAATALPLGLGFYWLMAQPWPQGHNPFAGQEAMAGRPVNTLVSQLPALLRFWPGEVEIDTNEQAAYPGLVGLGLGILGTLRRREARGWLLVALFALLLSLGMMTKVGGTRFLLPAGMLVSAVPALLQVHWWQRIAPLLALPLGIAALYGTVVVGGWLRRPTAVALVLALLALLDQATWPRGRVLPPPTSAISPPSELAPLLADVPAGALIFYPLPIINAPGPPVATGPYLLWQMVLQRPVSTRQSLLGDETIQFSYLSRMAANSQAQRRREGGGVAALGEGEAACARRDAVALREQGFSAAVLYLRFGDGQKLEPLFTAALGEPGTAGDLRVYRFDGIESVGEPCALPELAKLVRNLLPY